jgi:hypothetical protein
MVCGLFLRDVIASSGHCTRRGLAKRLAREVMAARQGRLDARNAASAIALNPGAQASQHKRWNAVPMLHSFSDFAVVQSTKEPELRIISSQRVERCSHTTIVRNIGVSKTVTCRSNFANFFAMKESIRFRRNHEPRFLEQDEALPQSRGTPGG